MEIVTTEKSLTCDKCKVSDFKHIDFKIEGSKKLCLSCLYKLLKSVLGEMI